MSKRCEHQFPFHGHSDLQCILMAGHKGHHKCCGEKATAQQRDELSEARRYRDHVRLEREAGK